MLKGSVSEGIVQLSVIDCMETLNNPVGIGQSHGPLRFQFHYHAHFEHCFSENLEGIIVRTIQNRKAKRNKGSSTRRQGHAPRELAGPGAKFYSGPL